MNGKAWMPFPGLQSICMVTCVMLVVTGCGGDAEAPKAASPVNKSPTLSVPQSSSTETTAPQITLPDDGVLHQSFEKATRSEPPKSAVRPPDLTITNKSVGKLYSDVKKTWSTIRFTDDSGKPMRYVAEISTALGKIEIELHPEWSPNHVRNFIALCRLGYYDGLYFDRIVREVSDLDIKSKTLLQVEAGCMLGTGQHGGDSLGYWLKREDNAKVSHQEGMVGACRGFEEDTSACKFYVTLSEAPYLDAHSTIFGKVTHGIEIVRKIYKRPVYLDDQDAGSRRPINPVVMKKVTVRVK